MASTFFRKDFLNDFNVIVSADISCYQNQMATEVLKEFLMNSDCKSRCLCFLAYKFIHGTQYTRMYPEKLNESYANETNCILTSFRVDTNETIDGYQYDCTEKAKRRK